MPRTDVPRTGDSPSVCIVTSELIRAIQERRRRHVDDRTGGTARDEGLKVTVLYTGAVWTPKVRLGPWIKYSAACGIELLPLATQNGTFPNRVLRIRLAPGGLAVESVETLFANDPRMTDPTLGVLARNRFFFNANGQWDEKDPARQLEALVLSVPVR